MGSRPSHDVVAPVSIPNVEILGEIGSGTDSVVYRGRAQGMDCAVKVWPEAGVADRRARSLREVAILARLRHAALPRVMEVGSVGGHTYVTMELVPGGTLAARLAQGPLAEDAIVALAKRLAGALGELHRIGLVHRDVKPANVLLGGDGAKLIDLGLATDAVAGRDAVDPAAGTLLYSPPEQTGMLKRPVDGRADLYSLGIMMWECAVGHPPYRAGDVAELARLHLASPVPGLRQQAAAVSPALAAIVEKLMAKDPEDRYQSAASLEADLDRLAELDAVLAAGRPVNLDRGSRYDLAELAPLVGREAEIDSLEHAWSAARSGKGSLALIEGPPGSGKSRLAREILATARRGGGIVLFGTCSEGSPVPLGALRLAVERYLRELRLLDADERATREAVLTNAAVPVGALVRALSPALTDFVTAALNADEPSDRHEQYYESIAEFFVRLAEGAGGALLSIDEVQWLDEASRQILIRLASRLGRCPLLVVATARTEPGTALQVERAAAELKHGLAARIVVQPLAEAHARALLGHLLGDGSVDPRFADQVLSRSAGNPFSIIEIARASIEQGLLRFSWGRWVLDSDRLEALRLPPNVIDLVVRRTELLGGAARDVLTVAAVLGSRFGLEVLVTSCAVAPDVVYAAVADGVGARVVERVEAGLYAFAHDRVREALLSQLSDEQTRALHGRIARALDRGHERVDDDEHVFTLAYHYARARGQETARRIYQTNLEAGLRALRNYADNEALGFLSTAERAADTGGMFADASLYRSLGEVYARVGKLAESRAYLAKAIDALGDRVLRAQVRARLAEIALASYDFAEARKQVQRGFADIGLRPVSASIGGILGTLGRWATAKVLGRSRLLWRLTRLRRREIHVTAYLLYQMQAFLAFFDYDGAQFVLAVLRSFYVAHRLGPSRELAYAYGSYAFLMGVAKRVGTSRVYTERALALGRALGDPVSVARAHAFSAMAKSQAGLAAEAEAAACAAAAAHERWLDLHDYFNLYGDVIENLLWRGYAAEAYAWHERSLARVGGERAKHPWPYFPLAVLAMLGRHEEAAEHYKLGWDVLERTGKIRFHVANFAARRLHYHYERGDTDGAEAALADWHRLRINPTLGAYQRLVYVLECHLRLEQLAGAGAGDLRAAWRKMRAAHRRLRRAANLPALACQRLVVEGAMAGLGGKQARAEDLLARAEAEARNALSPWGLYEAARWRATLLARQGAMPRARLAARAARGLATEHGWTARARRIELDFGLEPNAPSGDGFARGAAGSDGSPRAAAADLRPERHLEALLQVSLQTASILDPVRQARAALDEMVRLFGAERAFLFLRDEAKGELVEVVGRDDQRRDLTELTGHSSTVVAKVALEGRPFVVSGSQEGAVLGADSVVAHGLRSIMAAPLLLAERLIGVVYLDTRVAQGLFNERDAETLLAIASHIAIAIEAARTARVGLEREALDHELALTATMQSFFLPPAATAARGDLAISGYYKPATRCGGDWWWYDFRPDGRAVVLVGDVTGHGPAAAMVTAAVATSVRTLRRVGKADDIDRLLSTVNSLLVGLGQGEYCMTMSVVVVDPERSSMRWWCAGAPPVLLQRGNGEFAWLSARGVPLGSRPEIEEVQTVDSELPPGSRVIVFTDGILDLKRPDGRSVNLRRLAELAGKVTNMPIAEAQRRLTAGLVPEAGVGLQDDVTLVLLDRRG